MDKKPHVGMGVTISHGSDRYPGTIVEIANPDAQGRIRWFMAQRDEVVHGSRLIIDPLVYGDTPVITFYLDPNGATTKVTLRKDGEYRVTGGQALVQVGRRHYFRDPSHSQEIPPPCPQRSKSGHRI